MIEFAVRLIPVAAARHRSFMYRDKATGQTRIGSHSTQDSQKSSSEFIALADVHAPPAPLEGPLGLDLAFILPLPKSALKGQHQIIQRGGFLYHTKKPDNDNLTKHVMDALSRSGRFWRDDRQVCALTVVKLYGLTPETQVRITPLPATHSADRLCALQLNLEA